MASSNNVDSQADIVSLLQKISQDQAKVHEEVTSIRRETVLLNPSVWTLGQRKDPMESEFEDMDSKSDDMEYWKEAIYNRAAMSFLEFIQCDQSDCFEGKLRTCVKESMETFTQTIFAHVTKESQIVRSDARHLLKLSWRSKNQAEFAYFGRLPPELRLKIWKMACFNNSSVIKLHATEVSFDNGPLRLGGFRTSGYRVPALLHANHESREEARKHYTRVSIESGMRSEDTSTVFRSEYYNFDIDVLYLVIDEQWNRVFSHQRWIYIVTENETLCKFRCVAISEQQISLCIGFYSSAKTLFVQSLLQSGIEELIVVAENTNPVTSEQRLVPRHLFEEPHSNSHHGYAQPFKTLDFPIRVFSAVLKFVAAKKRDGDGNGNGEAIAEVSVPQFEETNNATSRSVPKITVMWLTDKYPVRSGKSI